MRPYRSVSCYKQVGSVAPLVRSIDDLINHSEEKQVASNCTVSTKTTALRDVFLTLSFPCLFALLSLYRVCIVLRPG